MPKYDRNDGRRRDVHAVDDDGMIACNPRDREAAHRAEVVDVSTSSNVERITCSKCIEAIRRAKA